MRPRSNTFHVSGFVAVIIVFLLVAGCATPRTAELQNATNLYASARANPVVSTNAPVTLYEAGQSLDRAEKAGSEEQQRHYAYLAQRQTEQAIAEANRKTEEQRIMQLGEQRDRIVLQSREREAAQARVEAQRSEQQTQMAQQQAAEARGQAETAREQARLATEQARQLESQLSELKARETDRGVMLTMSDIMFTPGQAVLTSGAVLSLNKLADILMQNPNEKVLIEGHTDNVGSAGYNQKLSLQRANAVRDALVARGASPDRIMSRGLGESFPVATNNTPAGRQQNRRVDIIVTG